LAYLIDTPGICVPNISNDETALKLSLMGCINDKISGREILLDYMLYVLNKNGNRKYLEKYKLEHPVETAEELVMHVRDKYH
jgi:ribosome biogenesis GTPase A